MGNYFRKPKTNVDIQDSQRLLLFDNLEEKIYKVEETMNGKYARMITMYNTEISNMKQEINALTKNNEEIVTKVTNLRVLINDKENKINQLEYKIINMESADQFLSSVEVDSIEPSLMN
jgi:predicted  nucleic acid-binding Zn-ribbon protein